MFEPGQILQERYQLQQSLGRPPQGRQTWLAIDSAMNPSEQVILKLLVFTEMQWHDLKLFEREAQVLKNLNHPRIPRYRDYFLVDQATPSALCWWALVQEYIPGRSLQDLLDHGTRWKEQEVRQIAEEVLNILNYLHSLNPPVLHRDIKPSNLILDNAQQVWLVDFGAVQDQAAVTGVSFTVVGTIGYAPLEQFWGRPVASSDLYALGVTLIHLLTGVSPVDLPQRDLRIQFSDRVNASSSFVQWIEVLTEPILEKRFTTADAALKTLQEGIPADGSTISGRIQTVCSPQSKRIQRLNPHIVVKQKTSKILEIEVRNSKPQTIALLVLWGLLILIFVLTVWMASPVLGGLAYPLAFIIAYSIVIAISGLVEPTNDFDTNSIQFDATQNRFNVKTQSLFPIDWEGKISQIRYLSITSYEKSMSTSPYCYTVWTVRIRANGNYELNWKLTEDECIWLVNEIQSWLDGVSNRLL
jgi:serine/threonine protein kinase